MVAADNTVSTGAVRDTLIARIRRVIVRLVGLSALRGVALAVLALLIVVRAWDPGPIELLRMKAFDFYQQVQPRVADRRPVVIVDIDEASLERFGQWPWPRTIVAELINQLTQNGAVAIALDVVFEEPDRTSPDLIADAIPELSDSARSEIKSVRNHDEIFAETLRTSRVVLGEAALIDERRTPDPSVVPEAAFAALGPDPRPYLIKFPELLPNIALLEEAAAGRGMFTIKPGIDGIVRRVPLVLVASDRVLPSLSLELLRVATGQRGFLIKSNEGGVSSVVLARSEIPTDRNAQMWVHYSPHDPARFISAADVIEAQAPMEQLAGKLVFVGTSASGLFDLRSTPLDPAMPGVEVHAQVVENILTQSYLQRPSLLLGAEVAATVLVGLLIIMFVPVLGALPVLILGALTAAGAAGVAWYAFTGPGYLVDVTFPLGATFAVYATLVFFNYYREERQKHQIRGAFGQYLSPALVEELARDPERLVLGGETRTMTFLFSDVRGFTSISESYKADPQGLTRLMNRFLTPLSEAIIERRGTIDKYMGDAVMAFWNAPLDDGEHAVNACEAALAMLENVEALNAERKAEAEATGTAFLPLDVGIGINTGECVVGNMGSAIRFDYSVLGDAVNLASRLEGQSKPYAVKAIVGSATREGAGDRFAFLELDMIRVKGKDEPERIFALLGAKAVAANGGFTDLTQANDAFLAAYRSADFDRAEHLLEAVRKAGKPYGLHGLFDLYAERIAAYRDVPPAPDWDGVFVATSK